MPETEFGKKFALWAEKNKQEFKADLGGITKIPFNVLRETVDKIAKTYPACNTSALAAVMAEEGGVTDVQAFSDFISAFAYIWDNSDGESPKAVTADLRELKLLSDNGATLLTDLLISAEPYRETAGVKSNYIRIGAPLFVEIRGTVDLRLRFHKTRDEYLSCKAPTELVGGQHVIMVSLTTSLDYSVRREKAMVHSG